MSTAHQDHDYALSAIPESSRRRFWPMLAVMMGFTFWAGSMWAGGTLGIGLTFGQFMLVVIAGNLILALYTGLLSYIAADTHLSTHLLARYAFGLKGSYIPSFMLAATQVGWFGVGVVMFALPIQKITGMNLYLLIAIGGFLMTLTAYIGFKALMILSIIAVPAIAIFGGISITGAVESAGGMQGILASQPTEALAITAALTICISSFISGGTLVPDFVRFSKTKRVGVLTTVIAFLIGNTSMFMIGAIGAIAFGQADVSEVMVLQGMIIPAIIVLGLNIWTTNDNALYASGLGFSNITKISKNKLVLFNGILGSLLAMWLYNNFVNWLVFLGSTLPSIGAIIIADYYIIRRRKYEALEDAHFQRISWIAVVAWISGVLLARLLPGIAPLNAVIGSFVLYIVLHWAKVFYAKSNVTPVEKDSLVRTESY
jgi:cytosine permease